MEHDVAEVAVFETGTDLAFVEFDRPIDAFDAADAEQVGIGQAGGFVDEADLVVHHPNVSIANVVDLAGGTLDDANEDGDLLGHQQRRERDAEDQANELGTIAGEHF